MMDLFLKFVGNGVNYSYKFMGNGAKCYNKFVGNGFFIIFAALID